MKIRHLRIVRFFCNHLDNGLDSAKLRKFPLDVLEVSLTGPQRAATGLGSSSSNGIRIAKAEGIGISSIGVASVDEVLRLLSTDLRGEVLGVAHLIDTGRMNNANFTVDAYSLY